MTKLAVPATFLFALASACSTDVDLSERPLFANGEYALTVLAYNGLTGAAVEQAQLTMRIGPHVLTAEAQGNAYTLAQLPPGTYPVFASLPGFLDFSGTWTSPTESTYDTRVLLLYPLQDVGQDITVRVFENDTGAPVSSGQVVATLQPDTIPGIIEPDTTLALTGQPGLRPIAISAALSNGVATIARNQLVMGGTYAIDVFGVTDSDGNYLLPDDTNKVQAGRELPQVEVFMTLPSVDPMVALTANNEPVNGLTPTVSTLVVSFPYTVTVCSDPATHTWSNMNTPDNGATPPTAAGAEHVGVALTEAATGSVLTLTARIAVGTDVPATSALIVRFDNIKVRVAGAATSACTDLDEVQLRSSATEHVDTTITMRPATNP